jgi:DNA-directed RNA polymerase specialized sigma24 family protein
MKTPLTPEILAQCEARLNDLTQRGMDRLYAFAEARLLKLGVTCADGQDLAQNALRAVLRGIDSQGDHGRRPLAVDVASNEAFEAYLKSIIVSMSDFRLAEFRRQRQQEQLEQVGVMEDEGELTIPDKSIGADEEAGWNNYKQEYFSRLRRRVPENLQATIDRWEPVFLQSDRIEAKYRKYAIRLRPHAAAVADELGGLRPEVPSRRAPIKAPPAEDPTASHEGLVSPAEADRSDPSAATSITRDISPSSAVPESTSPRQPPDLEPRPTAPPPELQPP